MCNISSLDQFKAWSNWEMAFGVLRLALSKDELPHPHVWGWGGGVSLGELDLAKRHGCKTVMISSREVRLEVIRKVGVTPLDRRDFPALAFEQDRFKTDKEYRAEYLSAEERQKASNIFANLNEAANKLERQDQSLIAIETAAMAALAAAGFRPEYFSICRATDLSAPQPGDTSLQILAAAWMGGARLIDNVRVELTRPLAAL